MKFQAGKKYLLVSGMLYTQAGLDSKGVKEQRFSPQDKDVCGNRRELVVSYFASFKFLLFVPLDENYNLADKRDPGGGCGCNGIRYQSGQW